MYEYFGHRFYRPTLSVIKYIKPKCLSDGGPQNKILSNDCPKFVICYRPKICYKRPLIQHLGKGHVFICYNLVNCPQSLAPHDLLFIHNE